MKIRDVIGIINQMQADGVIERYAIGGAVGATFHLEPVATLDVDVFVSFQSEPGKHIISPQRIFDYLTARSSRRPWPKPSRWMSREHRPGYGHRISEAA